MTEKEARDIFTEYGGSKIAYVTCYEDNSRFQYVKGYLERVEQEKEIFGPIVRKIVDRYDTEDHACPKCIPGGSAVIKNFRCAYHKAVEILRDNPSWK